MIADDAVLLVTIICLLDGPAAAFFEIHRILAPQGALVVGFIGREGPVARKCPHSKERHRFLPRTRFYASAEVRRPFGCTGFRVATIDSRAGFSVIAARTAGTLACRRRTHDGLN